MGRKDSENPIKNDQDLVKEIEELKRVVKALLKFVKNYENDSGEEHMPEGIFYEIEFK